VVSLIIMNALTTFTFIHPSGHNTHDIRVIDQEGNPWFVAADVCRALGAYIYQGKPNVSMACKKLNADEQGLNRIYTPMPACPNYYTEVKVVSESGLYKLAMRSDKPEARAFQDWVTREVLPSIRKHGVYVQGQELIREISRRFLGGQNGRPGPSLC
jgi:prophage antirepressor-like protein